MGFECTLCFRIGRFKSSIAIIICILSIVVFMQFASVRYKYISASYRYHVSHHVFTTWSSRNHCDVTRVTSWKENSVTVLQPRIEANCSSLVAGDEREFRATE